MTIEVIQADRAMAVRWFGHENSYLAKLFAEHRLATRTDATPVAWMYERKGQETLVFAYRWQDPVERPGWRETALAPVQRNADVAALVEAADWALAEIEGRTRYAPNDFYEAKDQRGKALGKLRQALAPFTKGQNDE